MGEKKINALTEEMIEQKLEAAKSREVRWIDPYKLAMWTLETACQMVDLGVSKKTIDRAISEGSLNGYKVGKEVCVVPGEFLIWFKRHKK